MAIEQLVIGGVATYDDLGLRILYDFEENPPEPKEYMVDVPGGDGSIDLTEYGGDVVYSDRTMKYRFLLPDGSNLSDLLRWLHGKRFDFSKSWDKGFTYNGRFNVTSGNLRSRVFEVSITADPYKTKGMQTWFINAAGGVKLILPNGAKRVCPTIEVQRRTVVSLKGRSWTIHAGTWRIEELWLEDGDNELLLNTFPDYDISTWAEYSEERWIDQPERLYDMCTGDSQLQESDVWAEYEQDAWNTHGPQRWIEMIHEASVGDDFGAYIQYEWKDL